MVNRGASPFDIKTKRDLLFSYPHWKHLYMQLLHYTKVFLF